MAILLLSIVVGITCVWDMRNRRGTLVSQAENLDPDQKPKIWDFVAENINQSGYEYQDAKWENIVVSLVLANLCDPELKPSHGAAPLGSSKVGIAGAGGSGRAYDSTTNTTPKEGIRRGNQA